MLDVNLFQLYKQVLQQQIRFPITNYFQLPPLLYNIFRSLHCLGLLQCKLLMV